MSRRPERRKRADSLQGAIDLRGMMLAVVVARTGSLRLAALEVGLPASAVRRGCGLMPLTLDASGQNWCASSQSRSRSVTSASTPRLMDLGARTTEGSPPNSRFGSKLERCVI